MKFKFYIPIIGLILVIAFLLIQRGFHSDFFLSDRSFSISDTARVNQIVIIAEDSLYLTKNAGKGWLVNGLYPAEPLAISNFLYAFSHIDIRGKTNEVSGTIPVREINIHTGSHQLKYSLISDENRDYLHRKGSKDYIISGIAGSPGVSFKKVTSDKADYWRSRLLLNIFPDDIKKIIVIPAPDRGNGFILEKSEKDFLLISEDGIPAPDSLVNMEKVLMYISYFSGIWYESVAPDTIIPDKTELAEPGYFVEVETREGKIYKLEIIPITENSGKADLFRAFVRMNGDGELFVVKYVMLDLLMQRYSHFII